ncbi:MAG: DUF4091 domain-containing protein [Clostridia bacterium]|nr:DUF4091 domain-containing protein [Clostridia bacterium]
MGRLRAVLSTVLVFTFLLLMCGCGSETDVSSASDPSVDAYSDVQSSVSSDATADAENYDIKAVVYNGFDKYSESVSCNIADTSFSVGMAKNETESVHISFTAKKDVINVKLTVLGDLNGIELQYFTENYVPCGDKLYPDPLVPFDGGEFSLLSGNSITFLVDIKTVQEVKSGKRQLKFCLMSGDEAVSNTVTVNLAVWDFTLSDASKSASAVSINKDYLMAYTSNYTDETYLKYYEMMLDHGLSPYNLPYDILDARADKYMSDPRVTAFRVPCSHDVEETVILAYCAKIKSNPEWLKKAYFYPTDEPSTIERLNSLRTRCEYLKELCPEIKIICPYYTNIDVTPDYDQTQFLLDTVDVPCPKPCMWEDEFIYSEAQLKTKPSFKSRMDDHLNRGRELWWYVCNTPGKPYMNVFVDENGLDHRVLFWQQYRYGVSGFLYWCTNYWIKTNDPWTDVDTKTLSYPVYGEGILVYPGEKVGIDGPVASLRLKCIRDGMEDYGLLSLAEQVLGKDYVLKKLYSCSTKPSEVLVDSNGFSALRNEIGNDIQAALKK